MSTTMAVAETVDDSFIPDTGDEQSGALLPLTDYGNAERLVKYHGVNLKYCFSFGKWYSWTGKYWREDALGEVMRCAKDTVRRIHVEATEIKPELAETDTERTHYVNLRNNLTRHAMKSEELHELKAMLELAQSEKGVSIHPDSLDNDPYTLCASNGTIDLRTGKLRQHNREDLITKMSPVAYDPEARCPRWDKFLKEVFDNDEELMLYIQRAVGYSLTADVTEQSLLFCYGNGANGKSTFMNVLVHILGEYAQSAPRSLIQMEGKGETGVPNDVARLKGVRLVTCSELEEGKALAEARVKELTGGDRITARFMRCEFFEFNPTHKLWMLGNHRPEIRGTDYGMWRRIHLIPFTMIFGPDKRDPDLGKKLMNEVEGILAWAVRGCLDWQALGLQPPKRVQQAVQEYRAAEDKIGQFIEDQCVMQPNVWVSSKGLYDTFKDWSMSLGDRPLSNKMFTGKLRDRGLVAQKQKQERGWLGITIKPGVAKIVIGNK